MKRVYLCGAVAGVVLPFSFFFHFMLVNGLDLSAFVGRLFQNDIAMFFAMDVLVSAVVLWVFVFAEGHKRGMKHLWVYVLCTLLVGVSLALPLFLFFRERNVNSMGK
jgi:uncharacterized protein DUF2834